MVERVTVWVGSKMSLLVHTAAFATALLLGVLGVAPWDLILLVLTTGVSLEAIYLAIFIQMTMNQQAASLKGVEEDIDEIQKDVDEIQLDVDEIQEDVDEIQKDVDEIQEDEVEEETRDREQQKKLEAISASLQLLVRDIENWKKGRL